MTLVEVDPVRWNAAGNDHGVEDRAAFTDAFVEFAPRLFAYLSRHVRPAEAEDLLGETFCTAWQQRARYRPDRGPLVGWLFGIATNLLKHHKRSWLRGAAAVSRLTIEAIDDVDSAERVAERVDAAAQARALAEGLLALKERDRDVLLLSSWGQLDHAEIAIALDIPIGTVRSRLHRARCHLLACMPNTRAITPHSHGESNV